MGDHKLQRGCILFSTQDKEDKEEKEEKEETQSGNVGVAASQSIEKEFGKRLHACIFGTPLNDSRISEGRAPSTGDWFLHNNTYGQRCKELSLAHSPDHSW